MGNNHDQMVSAIRRSRQALVVTFVEAAFGKGAMASNERCARFIEEAIELAQAEGVPAELIHKTADIVYSRPVGQIERELGGISLCLLAYAQSRNLMLDEMEVAELERVYSKSIDHFKARHQEKIDLGISQPRSDD